MSSDDRCGPELAAYGIRRSYHGRIVLDVAEIRIPAGRSFALIGPSGSGKSTLMRILGLLERPDAGRVEAEGRAVGDRERRELRMAAVFQKPHLFNDTVGDNVAYGLKVRGVPRRERRTRVADALERVGMAGTEKRGALTLSGGEAQRVALARALVIEPRVLLLDEPLSSLDPSVKRGLLSDLKRILGGGGPTTLYVTHDQDEAIELADRVGVLRDGRLVAEGATHEVMRAPSDDWVACFIGMAPPLRGVVVTNDAGMVTVEVGRTRIVAVSPLSTGTPVVLGVRPEDVLLFAAAEASALPPSSARNLLPGVVVSVQELGATASVVVDLGGAEVAAVVSRASAAELALAVGSRVLTAFKATAVHVAEVAPEG